MIFNFRISKSRTADVFQKQWKTLSEFNTKKKLDEIFHIFDQIKGLNGIVVN